MKAVAYFIGGMVAALIALVAFDPAAPADPAAAARQDICARMWQDAAPGWEKRTAREMCTHLGVRP